MSFPLKSSFERLKVLKSWPPSKSNKIYFLWFILEISKDSKIYIYDQYIYCLNCILGPLSFLYFYLSLGLNRTE